MSAFISEKPCVAERAASRRTAVWIMVAWWLVAVWRVCHQ